MPSWVSKAKVSRCGTFSWYMGARAWRNVLYKPVECHPLEHVPQQLRLKQPVISCQAFQRVHISAASSWLTIFPKSPLVVSRLWSVGFLGQDQEADEGVSRNRNVAWLCRKLEHTLQRTKCLVDIYRRRQQGTAQAGIKIWPCWLLAVWPWASELISLILCFLPWKSQKVARS